MAFFKDKKKRILLLVGFGTFLAFIFFSYLVHKNLFTHFDFNMTVRLQDHMPRRVDNPFSWLSVIGSFEVVSVVLLIVLAIYRKLKSFLVLLFFVVFHLIEIYGKSFVHHLPPPHFLLRTEQLVNFPQFYVSEQNSYPSGHAGRALFLTVLIGLIVSYSKKLSPTQKYIIYGVLVCYDVAMVTSRVYLGEHWTSDIIGGSLLGASFALLGVVFL